MFRPPVTVLPPSTERTPLSEGQRLDLIEMINVCVSSSEYKGRSPATIRLVGRLLNRLGDYEVACTYFEFANWIETRENTEKYLNSLSEQGIIAAGLRIQPYIESSFFLEDNESIVGAILQELMQRKGISASKRDEFLTEFDRLAARYGSSALSGFPSSEGLSGKKKSSKVTVWQDIKLPPGLKWPSRTYSEAAKAGVSIIDHLEAEWKDLIAAGIGTRQVVDAFDHSTTRGIENFRYGAPDKKRRSVPPHLMPLTKSQAIDRAIQEDPSILQRDHRVLQTMSNRLRRESGREKNQSLLTRLSR